MRQVFFIVLVFLIFTGCEKEKNTEIIIPEKTLLVYMAGENTLSKYTWTNLASIIEGATGSDIEKYNLLVYIDAQNSLPGLFKIEKDRKGVVDSVRVKTYPEQNSADKDVMNELITDIFTAWPAAEKGLFLWSHGTAWLPSNLSSFRAFGQDGNNWMEINDLRDALPGGLDYIVFDACYMASVEVVYALREKSSYIVGSSTEIIGDGFPYSRTIPLLLSSGLLETRLRRVCENFYTYYASHPKGGSYETANISLVKTAGLDNFAASCRPFLFGRYVDEEMVNPSQFGLNLQALEYLTSPVSYSYLYDFRSYMSLFDTQNSVNLSDVVLVKETTPTAFFALPARSMPINTYCGLSIYVPQVRNPKMNDWYRQLDWYKAVYE